MAGSPPVSLCVQPAGVQSGGRESGVAEAQALKAGMEQKAREFVEKGAEVYAKA
jgi:phosphomethylpyrimidine synthase